MSAIDQENHKRKSEVNSIQIVRADLNNMLHQEAIVELIDGYSRDPMGGGKPLDPGVKENLIPGLKSHPTTIICLALYDHKAVGIAVCFTGFSTFAAKSLINIHDLAVIPAFRKLGVGTALLNEVEKLAMSLGCCKITLEVLEKNHHAQTVYHSFGFNQGENVKEAGGTLFYTKALR